MGRTRLNTLLMLGTTACFVRRAGQAAGAVRAHLHSQMGCRPIQAALPRTWLLPPILSRLAVNALGTLRLLAHAQLCALQLLARLHTHTVGSDSHEQAWTMYGHTAGV